MANEIYQGDIYRFYGVKYPILIVSKNFFNKTGMVIGCPILCRFIISINGDDINTTKY